MPKQIKYFLHILLLAGLMITGLQGSDVLADETDVLVAAMVILTEIDCAQFYYYVTNNYYYPYDSVKTEQALTLGRHQAVYWNSPSIIRSSAEMKAALLESGIYNFSSADPAQLNEDAVEALNPGSGGDVRFRCRTQGDHDTRNIPGNFKCMAFRCRDPEPAPCAQNWRLEHTIQPHEEAIDYQEDGAFKCFDAYLADGDTCMEVGGLDWVEALTAADQGCQNKP